jgi:hypothetical protein
MRMSENLKRKRLIAIRLITFPIAPRLSDDKASQLHHPSTTPMKPLLTKPILSCLILLSLAAASSNAAVLFSDNFDVTGPSGFPLPPAIGPNSEITNPGRQGGSLGTLGYLNRNINEQVGNTTTLTPAPGSSLGDELLLAGGGASTIDYNFASAGTALEITFNALPNFNSGDSTNWFSFMVGDSGDTRFVADGSIDFGILFRQNGGTQYFVDGPGTTGASGTGVALNTWSSYKIVLSDTAGTGSAFGSGGSRVDYYQDGTLLGSALLPDQLTSSQGYFGFGSPGGSVVGIDNLVVSSVPEPSSVMVCLGSLAGLTFLRRRK